jgi:hypothetical protein
LSSEELYDLRFEYDRQSKIGTEVYWSRMGMDKANNRRWTNGNIITPYFLHFDVGAWMESQMNPKERNKFKFHKNYAFITNQEIDSETRLNKMQPKDNWKNTARVIRLRSLLKAANKHICNDHASYRRILEVLFIVIAHVKKIKRELVMDTIKKAIKLCNKKPEGVDVVRFIIWTGENFRLRGWLGLINFIKRSKNMKNWDIGNSEVI